MQWRSPRELVPRAFVLAVLVAIASSASGADIPVSITVDAGATGAAFKAIYRFFGADEPNYATMPDGEKLIGDIGNLTPAGAFFRTHNLLCTGDGTPALKWGSTNIYTEDAQGNPIYDYTIVDRIFDTYIQHGVRPYVEIGFMPKALSSHPDPYQHHWAPGRAYGEISTGWSYPPTDYAKWGELAYQWARRCVERYGQAEVEKWYWEVWNEANTGSPTRPSYWRGTPQDFMKLHDYAIDGVRRALPTARVGGPDSAGAGGQWTRDFLEHCLHGTNYATGKTGTPIDFTSFHAKGSPSFVNGHVRMGISNQLRTMDEGFSIIGSFPELKDKPIVIGESDPDGCAACTGPQLGYRNTTMYSSYTAATFARAPQIAARRGVNLEGATTWAFEFEGQPIFAGFRAMCTTGGINLPVFNVFRMFGKMSGRYVAVHSDGEVPLDQIMRSGVRGDQPDVSAIATIDGNRLFVFAWHYHDDDIPGPDAAVTLTLTLKNLPASGPMQLQHYRVDADHSNSYDAWLKMGSPRNPTPAQMEELGKAGQLEALGAAETVSGQTIAFNLPRQAVSLLVLSW
jgi:xylan 1,4-beta-xylosidase